jgi:tRNA G18 (ribose-2'-O)-methylase SpoU
MSHEAIMKNVQSTHEQHRPRAQYPLSILAQDVEDPANVGSLFRLADALGVRHLYLTGSTPTPPNVKLRRTARSADQYVGWSYHADCVELAETLKAQEQWLISLEISSMSKDIRDVEIPDGKEVVLIVGAENLGVCQALLDCCDQTTHIVMHGNNSSMNVSMAAALGVFELTRKMTCVVNQ